MYDQIQKIDSQMEELAKHTKELILENQKCREQITLLSAHILKRCPEEVTEGSAVDVAINIIDKYLDLKWRMEGLEK